MKRIRAAINQGWARVTAKPRALIARFHAIKEHPAPPGPEDAPTPHSVTAFASTGPLDWLGRLRVLFGWSVNFRVLIYATEPGKVKRALVSLAVQPQKQPPQT